MRRLALLALGIVLVALPTCGGDDSSAGQGGRGVELSINTADGAVRLSVEVADDRDERAQGLMGRERLDPFDGMAFVWDEPVRSAFWMKDTLIPLSIAFWDEDGTILSILDMEPCEADPCPTYDPGVAFLGALEVGQGRFAAEGVEIGDRIDLADVT